MNGSGSASSASISARLRAGAGFFFPAPAVICVLTAAFFIAGRFAISFFFGANFLRAGVFLIGFRCTGFLAVFFAAVFFTGVFFTAFLVLLFIAFLLSSEVLVDFAGLFLAFFFGISAVYHRGTPTNESPAMPTRTLADRSAPHRASGVKANARIDALCLCGLSHWRINQVPDFWVGNQIAAQALLQLVVRFSQALVLPQVFRPRVHQKYLEIPIAGFGVVEYPPAVCAVTTPYGFVLMNCPGELRVPGREALHIQL